MSDYLTLKKTNIVKELPKIEGTNKETKFVYTQCITKEKLVSQQIL